GARTRDGKLQEFKKTYAMLAKELNLPVIPMVVQGAFEAMPFGQKPKWGSKMSLKVLDPIDTKGKTVEEIIEESKRMIAEELKK
ncbi:MAG TPA: lysophospholipid acyltransferase family protein, partial [Fusobacterium sp.]